MDLIGRRYLLAVDMAIDEAEFAAIDTMVASRQAIVVSGVRKAGSTGVMIDATIQG